MPFAWLNRHSDRSGGCSRCCATGRVVLVLLLLVLGTAAVLLLPPVIYRRIPLFGFRRLAQSCISPHAVVSLSPCVASNLSPIMCMRPYSARDHRFTSLKSCWDSEGHAVCFFIIIMCVSSQFLVLLNYNMKWKKKGYIFNNRWPKWTDLNIEQEKQQS